MFDEAELSVYEELWDSARMITDKVCNDDNDGDLTTIMMMILGVGAAGGPVW